MKPKLKYGLARRLRKTMTPPEVRLWVRLRSRGDNGLVFRRQHPVGPYVLDFYCLAARLCSEVDGVDHTREPAVDRDAKRDAWLKDQGVETLRLLAWEILRDAEEAAQGVYDLAIERVKALENAPPPLLRNGPPPRQS